MRILLTTHGSPHDELALSFGAAIARYAGEPPTVLTVIRDEDDRVRAAADLERARQLLAPALPDIQTKIRIGPAAQEIVREAEEGAYTLVVVGENANPNLVARFLAGSTAIRVVEHAPCAVVVAKGRITPIKRILLCDSGAVGLAAANASPNPGSGSAPGSSLLSRFTGRLARLLEGKEEITVLHVMSQISAGPGVRGTQLRATAEDLIEERAPEGEVLVQDLADLADPGVRVVPKVRHGLVVDEILEEANAGDYDLVVIGAHRGEGWQRILLDDLAHRIIVQLDRPVLVVR
jgi:nucleotide-binding universal stress UspA family protein